MKNNFKKIRSSAPDARTPVRTNTTSHAPAPQSSGGGMMSGLMGTMAQGLAFGTGSAIAHRAVGAVANSFGAVANSFGGEGEAAPASADQRSVPAFTGSDACSIDKANFFDCLKANEGDVHSCQFLADAMKACQVQQLNGGSKW